MRRSIQLLTLHCVVVIAEEGSFLGASQRLNIHHTSISRRVRELELTLGVTLFDRHSGGVRLTAAGERFLSNLRRVLTDLDGALSVADRSGSGETGRLSIGIDAPLPACGYVDALVEFVRNRPDVDIRFTEAPRAELRAGLSGRTIDVVIAPGFDRRGSGASLSLWPDRIAVAMAMEHPMASRREIDWEDLVAQTILDNQQSVDLTALSGITANRTFPLTVRHDVSRLSLLNLVRKGLGVTLIPESDAASLIEGVVSSALKNSGSPVRLRYDAHWRSDNSNPVLAAFVAFLRTKYPEA